PGPRERRPDRGRGRGDPEADRAAGGGGGRRAGGRLRVRGRRPGGLRDGQAEPDLEAQSKHVQLAEVKLHYLEWEHPGSTPLLILPGLAGSAHNWSHIAEALAEERRVL